MALAFTRSGGWGQEQFNCDSCRAQGLHHRKNCRKYAPDSVDPEKPDWWTPEYKDTGLVFRIDNISSNECPVSAITPDSRWLVEILSKNLRVHRAAGAPMYGTDSGLWPAWWFDAVEIAQRVIDMEEAAAAQERARRQPSH